ncbi:MAG TPA: 2-phospho-L-lactate transferase [Candidatus Udaeobacter sp.]|nr:2-phospho-L-lactate transferase [Candidatus Udaeobacter sp.]
MKVAVLAGGTGGAALAAGIAAARPDCELSVIANTADDDEFWGLLVCPDIDAVLYRLAGLFDDAAGFGIKGDSTHVLDTLRRAGQDTWFRLGDRDFATHIMRTSLLRSGRTLTEATIELCRRFGVGAAVLPMTDSVVRTRFTTDAGELSFQEYFVREGLRPRLYAIEFAGIEAAAPTGDVVAAIDSADLVVIGPSNPLISIAPILRLTRPHLRRERTVAVTPIVGGASLKGPTVDMMKALRMDATPVEVARIYREAAGGFIVDQRDRALAAEIQALGYRTVVADTVMKDGGRALAETVLRYV